MMNEFHVAGNMSVSVGHPPWKPGLVLLILSSSWAWASSITTSGPPTEPTVAGIVWQMQATGTGRPAHRRPTRISKAAAVLLDGAGLLQTGRGIERRSDAAAGGADGADVPGGHFQPGAPALRRARGLADRPARRDEFRLL